MIIVSTTAALLLLLFLSPSCGYVSSLRDSYRLVDDSSRTRPTRSRPPLDHPHRCYHCYTPLALSATNDPISGLSLDPAPLSPQLQLQQLPTELLDRLQDYADKWRLQARLDPSTSYIANQSNSSIANTAEKNVNVLAMFQPSGFYKDQVALELASRADKSTPYDPHVSKAMVS